MSSLSLDVPSDESTPLFVCAIGGWWCGTGWELSEVGKLELLGFIFW